MDYHQVGLRHALARIMPIAAFVACTWVPSVGLANNNAGLRTIPLHISNHINQAQNLFVLIFGLINRDNGLGFPVGAPVYVTNIQGDVAIVPQIPAPGIPLGINLGMGTEIDLMLPKLTAVRIYSSVGNALVMQNGNTHNQLNPPDNASPSDPNFNTMYDFTELTWLQQAPIPGHPEITTNLGINVTEVDSFGLAQQYTIEGTDPATFQPNTALTSGFLSTARRPDLLNMLQSFGSPWSDLIVGNGGVRARALMPALAIPAGVFPSTQLDSYTAQIFTRYASSPPLTTTVNVCTQPPPGCAPIATYNFTGSTAGGEFVFSDASKGGPIFSLAQWSTLNAYAGSFPYGSLPPQSFADTQAALAVQAKLQGAIMRSTLLVNSDLDNYCSNPAQFYVNPPVNMYAKLWHQAGINGKAYGFGFDDTCNESSFKLIFNPTKLTINLLGNRGP
jgi:hypothetical protein